MRAEAVCAALLVLCAGAASATSPHRHVSQRQAEALVLAALDPPQRKLPKLEAVPDEAHSSAKFMGFTVVWAGEKNGSVVVGTYAVDRDTGDVFGGSSECDEKKNPRLALIQTRVRAAIHLAPSDYRRVKSKGPLCED